MEVGQTVETHTVLLNWAFDVLYALAHMGVTNFDAAKAQSVAAKGKRKPETCAVNVHV
ncbi:MAG: hypothetical protein Cons2KO_14360 [Congregibacter sp.]